MGVKDVGTKAETFKDLLSPDIFRARGPGGESGHLYVKLLVTYAKIGTCGGPVNAVSLRNGQHYLFQDGDKVELDRHSWEWAQGYQATENCLECGRPREEV